MTITSFLKTVAKGVATQLGVSAVHAAVWPQMKKFGKKFLDKAAAETNKSELENLVNETKRRQGAEDASDSDSKEA